MLSLVAGTALLAQITVRIGGHAPPRDTAALHARSDTVAAHRDSARARRDSIRQARRAARLVPLTPQILATAFRDPEARTLLARARAARLSQDSTLTSYDATTYEYISAGIKFGGFMRSRTLFRSDRTTRVRWSRADGAVVDVTGERAAFPIAGQNAQIEDGRHDVGAIPYFPGRETLWLGSSLARATVAGSELIHPLAAGAEAYYTYATGDSLSFQLPGGRRVVVRELRVTPRRSSWNTVVGSLWFDVGTGQLVRGVFRLAEPLNVMAIAKQEDGEDPSRDIPLWLRPAMLPMTAGVDVITVDYGLFNGRYWLPRSELVQGRARVGPMHVPFSLRQRFDYTSVNSTLSLPQVRVTAADTGHSVAEHAARRIARERACHDTTGVSTARETRFNNSLAVLVRVPCDTLALLHSPTLPRTAYSRPDSLFDDGDLGALVQQTLGLGDQAGFAPQPPEILYGLGYTRYDKIEGLSSAVEARQQLGSGYSASGLARIGLADLSPEGHLSLSRTDGRETYTGSVYRRLVAANDWGRNPFSLGASLSALLFGHDDGVYYRSWGAELVHRQTGGIADEWRLFAEHEGGARPRADFSFAGSLRARSRFPDNINVTTGNVVGLSLRRLGSLGDDPEGTRLLSDVRLEGAAGTFDYTRAMANVTISHPLAGPVDAALTLSGGASGGAVPTQRLWYLGGAQTVRGQDVGVEVGNAYWLTRLELGLGSIAARPVVFGDLGWAGDRRHWRDGVVPVSGVGVGASFLDGLVRFDVAKGVRPANGVRAMMYMDARF